MTNVKSKKNRKTIHDLELKNIYPDVHNPNLQRQIEIQLYNAFKQVTKKQ